MWRRRAWGDGANCPSAARHAAGRFNDQIFAESACFFQNAAPPPAFPASRAKLPHGVSYVSPLLLDLFSRVFPACRLFLVKNCAHAGGPGSGEYCGENDTQLGCINVIYHEAPGSKSIPCAVLFDFEPDRCSVG
jgi:hypothetical protein